MERSDGMRTGSRWRRSNDADMSDDIRFRDRLWGHNPQDADKWRNGERDGQRIHRPITTYDDLFDRERKPGIVTVTE